MMLGHHCLVLTKYRQGLSFSSTCSTLSSLHSNDHDSLSVWQLLLLCCRMQLPFLVAVCPTERHSCHAVMLQCDPSATQDQPLT